MQICQFCKKVSEKAKEPLQDNDKRPNLMLRLITKKRGRDKVLTMAELDDIRDKFFDKGKNISQINRETGHARQTIRNAINQKTFQFKAASRKISVTKLAPYYEIIDKWLIEDKQFKKKQRHTPQRVYNRLVELYPDFAVSYRTVAYYFKLKYKEIWQSNGFLPLQHTGGEAQVDFGKAEYFENGQRVQGSYVVISFPYSNGGYSLLFPGEALECLLEAVVVKIVVVSICI